MSSLCYINFLKITYSIIQVHNSYSSPLLDCFSWRNGLLHIERNIQKQYIFFPSFRNCTKGVGNMAAKWYHTISRYFTKYVLCCQHYEHDVHNERAHSSKNVNSTYCMSKQKNIINRPQLVGQSLMLNCVWP